MTDKNDKDAPPADKAAAAVAGDDVGTADAVDAGATTLGDDLFEEFELPGGPPKDAAEMAADDADLPLWEEEWEDEDACSFLDRLKAELAARA